MITFTWIHAISRIHTKQILDVFLSAFLSQNRSSAEQLSDYFNQKIIPRLSKGHLTHVASEKDKIVGFVIFEKWEKSGYYLAEMAILPQYQRQGIGKQLVFSIFEKDHDVEKILLITEKQNRWSQVFYEKIGFQHSPFQHPDYPENFVGYEYNRRNQPH